jgi:hypothetical protein
MPVRIALIGFGEVGEIVAEDRGVKRSTADFTLSDTSK